MPRHLPLLLGLLTLVTGMAGCNMSPDAAGGQVSLQSLADADQALATEFDHGLYRREDENSLTAILFAGPPEQPRRALTLRLFWMPRAGATSLDASATNATFHYVVFDGEGDAVAVYSGAGFVSPRSRIGKDPLELFILDTTVHLVDASEGYADPIGPGRLTGDLLVARNHDGVEQALDQLNRLVRERLGHPRLVESH
ncbi:MAG: hypothetical protein WDZ31_08675 [Phycisphaeraceae bacterium]